MEGNMPYAGIFGAAQPLTILEKFFLKKALSQQMVDF